MKKTNNFITAFIITSIIALIILCLFDRVPRGAYAAMAVFLGII